VSNPLSPFANRFFPNPYVHISFEDGYRSYFSHYELKSRSQIPLQVTVQGNYVEGFLGPLFLLTPFALVALRYRAGRQLLLAAAIFASTYFTNIGTRFLMPAVPFVTLALALVAADVPWLLPLLTIACLITCWPDVYNLYVAPGAYRIEHFPLRAALRLQNEQDYLAQDPQYLAVLMIGSKVPRDAPILAVNQNGQSYLQRDLRIGYESAENEVLQDILWTPVVQQLQPRRFFRFDCSPLDLRKLRVVQTANLPNNQWSISELRVFNGAMELPRDPAWRLRAHPNPWDVQLAFDNTPVTRWRSWESAAPGMYVEVDFGKLESVSAVTVQSSDDDGDIKMKLEGAGSDGNWITLADHAVESHQNTRASLRMAATNELKVRGIRYVVIKSDNPGAEDYRRYPSYWGLKLEGISGETRLYRIQ